MDYGALKRCDIQVLELVMDQYSKLGRCKFLEIGIYAGHTSRGIKGWFDAHGVKLDFWCIDDASLHEVSRPFAGANLVVGDSAESFHLVPDDFDVIFVDGCHCINHAILDTLHYGKRVVKGGFMVFHDTNPFIQNSYGNPHGPKIPEFNNAVNDAHEMIGFPFPPWTLFSQQFNPQDDFGGTSAFRKGQG